MQPESQRRRAGCLLIKIHALPQHPVFVFSYLVLSKVESVREVLVSGAVELVVEAVAEAGFEARDGLLAEEEGGDDEGHFGGEHQEQEGEVGAEQTLVELFDEAGEAAEDADHQHHAAQPHQAERHQQQRRRPGGGHGRQQHGLPLVQQHACPQQNQRRPRRLK